MITTERMSATSPEQSDTMLVSQALAGNRSAFGQIVARYQSLICSMAYSATGNLSKSEDLAQDTFIAAWKQLPQLKEQGKLRGWLCGIARFLIGKAVRKDGREPSHGAESLDVISETSTQEALPRERAMTKEEEAILWRSIERIPETYREALVLFYREHQSIEMVAASLELSEDAVKQRLSRGRKLLQEEVLGFVEGALARTGPGRAFTIGVLAALPALVLPAQAAAVGTVAAKGAAKATAGGMIGALLGPLVAFFGMWVGYRMDMESASSDVERQFTKGFYRRLVAALIALHIALAVVVIFAPEMSRAHAVLLPGSVMVIALGYLVFICGLMRWYVQGRCAVSAELISSGMGATRPAWEYCSRARFLGMPLVNVRIGGNILTQKSAVKGWIAIGDTAVGGLFAFGGIAVAPLSVGGCAIGLLPFGGMAIGLIALGGLSVGAWAFGGLALGWQAFGGCAVAWNAAAGGVAVAVDYALGGTAQAAEANTAAARGFIQEQGFFRTASYAFQHYLAWLNLVWVLPLMFWWRRIRRAKAMREA